MTLGEVVLLVSGFSLGFVLATIIWLWTFAVQQKKMLNHQIRMQQNYGRNVSEE